jgi:hypothetical protein
MPPSKKSKSTTNNKTRKNTRNEECKDFKLNIGSRVQVWNGTACKTSGGLKKDDIMKNKRGNLVSKKKHDAMVKEGLKRFGKKLAPPFQKGNKKGKNSSSKN